MSSSTIFNIVGAILVAPLPLGHTQMYNKVMAPGLKALGNSDAAYSSKVSWTQANGYFILSGLLCFKWANDGLGGSLDKYILGALLATQSIAGLAYFKKGIFPPALVYWTTSLLMGIAALKSNI